MKLRKFFNGLALASVLFLIITAGISALVGLWLVHFNLTLSPFKLRMEINRQPYQVGFVNPLQTIPTPTSRPTSPPLESAMILKISGHPQLYTLDCEARSAVDLAGYFGVMIDEKEFLKQMPHSSNPNTGFVGNYWDARGKLPPQSYGIYADPIAEMLRSYGVKAASQHSMSFEQIRDEISSGRPVMVWVTGNTETGWATTYTTPDGQKIPVSPFEHTVILTGYDPDYVYILDGDSQYKRIKADFLKSWSNLGNMAVTVSK